jgi:DNA-binding ferritin-like protein
MPRTRSYRLKNTMPRKRTNESTSARKYHINQSFDKEIVIKFIEILNTVKIYHWKTYSYATHKATDELYEKLNKNIDSFIEVLLGKGGNRIDLLNVKSIRFSDFRGIEEFKREINRFKEYLISLSERKELKSMANYDLFTIRDDILADFNQFLYLLTFNK